MIRRYAVWSALCAAFALFFAGPAAAQAAAPALAGAAEGAVATDGAHAAYPRIVVAADDAESFDAKYDVKADGSVDVTQTIVWDFPSGNQSHGILRTVTVRAGYKDSTTQYRAYELSGVSVSSPTGAPTDLAISDMGAMRQLRIGSPSETVSGRQTYIVKFTLGHVVNDIGDGTAEFYFDHISVSNNYDYRNITAEVTGPVAGTKAACFYGPRGSDTPCTATAGETSTFAVPNLGPGDGASILVSYPRSAFTDLTPDLREGNVQAEGGSSLSPQAQQTFGWLASGTGVLLPLLAAGLMGLLVWTRGRDEQFAGLTPGLVPGADQGDIPVVRSSRAPVVAVQFAPPAGVQPGMLGTIIDEEANVIDVTATIIDLAVRGHLQLTAPESSSGWQRDDWVLSRTQPPANAAPLAPYEQTLLDAIFFGNASGIVNLSDLKNHFAPTLALTQQMMYDETVERGWFRRSPQRARNAFWGFATVLGVASLVTIFLGVFGFSGQFADSGLPINPILVLGVGGLIAAGIIGVLGRKMASRTALGSAVLAQSRGFEQYLRTAEADQIKWEEAQDIFSRYLPYAIVFGVAERWAKVFDDVASRAAAAGHDIGMPVWYVGTWGTGGFDGIASDLDSFSTEAAGTFVSTPASSGSSGFSMGGGFSGGGGAGSGGGSW